MSVTIIPSTPALRRAVARSAQRRFDWRGWVLPLALLGLWLLATTYQWVDTRILVTPLAVLKTAWVQLSHQGIWIGLGASLARDFSGFLIGTTTGLSFALLLGTSRLADRAISPTFNALKQIAVFAWIPLIAVWFGMGEPAKVVFIALVVFFPVMLNAYEGIRSVNRDYVEVARAFEFTRFQLFRRVILPAATPQIFTGLRLGLIYAWLATIGAEYFLKAGPGIGNVMIDGREHFLMDQVIFGVAIVGVVGYFFQSITARIENRLLRWRSRNG